MQLDLKPAVPLQAVKSLMVWAADVMRSLDMMGATPLDLAMESDAQQAIAALRSI